MKNNTVDSLSIFFQTIRENLPGFAVKKDHDIIFAQNKNQIFTYHLKEDESNDIENRFLDVGDVDLSSCPLDENNDEIVFVLGEHEYLPEEYHLLEFLMREVGIIPDKNIICSIVGNTSPVEPKTNLFTYDFGDWISEKTKDFVGRQDIMDSIDDFIAKNTQGYCMVSAKPGMGKTVLVAHLVREKGHIHHFNIRSEGINQSQHFLKNMCAQLILRYGLDYHELPSEATQNSNFLLQLLSQISENILSQSHEKLILIVDGLDEVEEIKNTSVNVLNLPTNLPNNVYIVATMRQGASVTLHTTCASKTIEIKPDSEENVQDTTQYIKNQMQKETIQEFISLQKINEDFFASHIYEKSEGNFIYLYYVLSDIEQGIYNDLGFDKIPKGLQQYYEQHWQIIKGRDEDTWFEYKLPVLVALTVTKRSISVDLISKFSKVSQLARVYDVLEEWKQFLYEESVLTDDIRQKRYRLYHDDFHDFITRKDQVVSEKVDLARAEKQIINSLLPEDDSW